ncbi:hypothetical protein AT728_06715 [Streptomyces silvensis]|uniref:Extensin n=1 Tax=Streptomyces silvensis TaxID=1765722 RepID=A0A0W7X7G4_9ACTN|nr:hypothetical protein AT728_06715 [Streptomyces silvensis]
MPNSPTISSTAATLPARAAAPAPAPATVQRSTTPAKPVRLRPLTSLTPPSSTPSTIPSSTSRPRTQSPLPVARIIAPVGAPAAVGTGGAPSNDLPVQRGVRSATRSVTGTLAAAAANAVGQTMERFRTSSQGRQSQQAPQGRQEQEEFVDDPLPFPPDRNPETVPGGAAEAPPPAYSRVPKGTFDPKDLTDFQIDELVHRMIGRITRLVRTELRMDRERIGRLRDDRR